MIINIGMIIALLFENIQAMSKIISAFILTLIFSSLNGKSLLLEEGESSNGYGLSYASNALDNSIGLGWIHSEFKFEVGAEFTHAFDSEVSVYGIFGNYYLLRQEAGLNLSAGLEFASARRSFETQYILLGVGGVHYVIASESLKVIPKFQIGYGRNLTEGSGGEDYGVGVTLGIPLGYRTLSITPGYSLLAPRTFSISAIFQM